MASNSNFIHVKNDQHYQNLIKDAGERLIIVDFTASWCGPCHHIAPFFEKLSERFINVLFLKVDVDECQETAIGNGVSAMPTFHAIRNGVKVEEVKGANPHPLVSMIEKWIRLSQPDNKKETISVGRSFESFLELRKNPDEKFLDVSELLIKFASNVLKDQKSEKYRTVRLENKIFQSRLLPVAGAVESLFTMGFEEQDDKLVLPQGCPLANLVAMRDALIDEREKINLKNSPIDLHPPVVVEPKTRKWKPFIRNSKETSFYERLKSTSDHVFIYEDPVMMSFALLKIPLEELKKKAKEQSVSTGNPNGSVNDLVDERDCLLLLLLNWFKCDFFKWMDQPTCTFCDVGTHSIGHVMPTSVDRKWGAGTVESYNCPQCSRKFTFPRYNHPQKLLETRTGRCGEWANCFTACCRAAGFEARYVLDWTDHVWTEVYSEHQKRWLHCDACENVCDKPLLYEAGWGKKLTYVFAFSKDEVIDVTWRYSQDHNENLKRRNEVGESWLVSLWTNMSKELQSSLTDVRRKVLESRRIAELVEFLRTKEVNKGEKIGRQSGSVAWRKIRGEDGGHNDDAVTVSEEHHVFIPTMPELEDGRLRIRYCGASDEYMRGDGGSNDRNSVSIKGWENGTSKSKDVFRKVEHDWKMAYLARKEGFSDGYIEWKFRIDNPLFVFDQITLKLSSKTYENGSVMVILKNGEIAENIESSKGSTYESSKFKGCSELQIGVHLTGGKGDVAWQHAQLFRQTLDSKDEYPFDFDVTIFKK